MYESRGNFLSPDCWYNFRGVAPWEVILVVTMSPPEKIVPLRNKMKSRYAPRPWSAAPTATIILSVFLQIQNSTLHLSLHDIHYPSFVTCLSLLSQHCLLCLNLQLQVVPCPSWSLLSLASPSIFHDVEHVPSSPTHSCCLPPAHPTIPFPAELWFFNKQGNTVSAIINYKEFSNSRATRSERCFAAGSSMRPTITISYCLHSHKEYSITSYC